MSHATSIEVYTPSGVLLCKAILTELKDSHPSKAEPLSDASSKPERGNGSANGESITDPQKRLLFRLMATNYHLERDQATEKLKDLFGVSSFTEISKFAASKMIERLLEEERGGNHD